MGRKPKLSARWRAGDIHQKGEHAPDKAPNARAARSKARAGPPKPAVAKKKAKPAAKGTRSSSRRPMPQGAPRSSELKTESSTCWRWALSCRQCSCRSAARRRCSGICRSWAAWISRRLSTGRSWAHWRSACERVSVLWVSCVVLACSSRQDASIEPSCVVCRCVEALFCAKHLRF